MTVTAIKKVNPEYDSIGEIFKTYEGAPGHVVETRTIFNLAGDVTGKAVLDLACGYGYFGRELHKRGAAKVVGVDISQKMIDIARAESGKNGDDIEFYVRNVGEMEVLGRFDIVTAAFLFNYADSLTGLQNMFSSVARNLKPGGRLVAYTVEPDYDLQRGNFSHYGVEILDEEPWYEGFKMRAEFTTSSAPSPFTFYRWSRKDYERAIIQAGFSNFFWQKPMVLESDLEKYPEGFWDIYQKNGFHTALVCEL